MNIVKAEFIPLNKKTIDHLEQALVKIQSSKDETITKIKRVRSLSAKQIRARRIRAVHELDSQELSQKQEWAVKLEYERKALEAQLIKHVHQKCRDIIHEILRALIEEVPEIALIHAYKRLDSLLTQLPNHEELAVTASPVTLGNPEFLRICDQHRVTHSTDDSFSPGAFSLSLPHGRVLASVEEDLKQLLENWGEGLELMRELQSFFENQNG